MTIPDIRVTATKDAHQERLVQTQVSIAFDQQVDNLDKYGGPGGRMSPTSATEVFLGAIRASKPEGQGGFTYDKEILETLKNPLTREIPSAISRENLVFSAYSFLDELNRVVPNKRHKDDKALADFINGPFLKQVLNVLFAKELHALVSSVIEGMAKQTPRANVPREKLSAMAKPRAAKSEKVAEATAVKSEQAAEPTAAKSEQVTEATAPQSEQVAEATAPQSEKVTEATAPQSEKVTEATAPQSEKVTEATAPQSEKVAEATAPQSEKVTEATAPQSEQATKKKKSDLFKQLSPEQRKTITDKTSNWLRDNKQIRIPLFNSIVEREGGFTEVLEKDALLKLGEDLGFQRSNFKITGEG